MAAQALAALNFRHDFNGRDMAGRRSRRQIADCATVFHSRAARAVNPGMFGSVKRP
ncbi:hypothetical protein [Rhizobium phaseoli]|uniref:hypothetical protein n=1 Tax=Rhizobium phaseoli TaxID=396 RepID=UPI000ACD8B33|nr:hypothetical protein [Rhizobium phaseoli]